MKGFQFRKSIKLLPGVRFNISKTGVSLSLGPRGAHVTTGPRGTELNIDLPGSGAYYRRRIDLSGKDETTQKTDAPVAALNVAPAQIPASELELANALRELQAGDEDEAYRHAQQATHLADGAFVAGFLALHKGQFAEAADDLKRALDMRDHLGEVFPKYDVDMAVELPITEEIDARIQPNVNGVLLALAEAYQNLGMSQLAIEQLTALHGNDPDDIVVRLSLAELLSQTHPDDESIHRQIVELAQDVQNDSPIHAALMLYRAGALRKSGLFDGALDTLTKALRRKKDYPSDLLLALGYERALVYKATGKEKLAQTEFQKIYAEAPGYEDVAAQLGL